MSNLIDNNAGFVSAISLANKIASFSDASGEQVSSFSAMVWSGYSAVGEQYLVDLFNEYFSLTQAKDVSSDVRKIRRSTWGDVNHKCHSAFNAKGLSITFPNIKTGNGEVTVMAKKDATIAAKNKKTAEDEQRNARIQAAESNKAATIMAMPIEQVYATMVQYLAQTQFSMTDLVSYHASVNKPARKPASPRKARTPKLASIAA